jgi:hypothetical protein
MTKFHAVMIDETGCEFGVDIKATSRGEAHDLLHEDYPESRCDQLESAEDTRDRERRMYAHISAGGDWDDEGRPIFHY